MSHGVITLLDAAERCGASLRVRDGRVEIRHGDRLPDDVRRSLVARKNEVIEVLTRGSNHGSRPAAADRPKDAPASRCRVCNAGAFWCHATYGHWLCGRCYPPPKPELVGAEHHVAMPAKSGWPSETAALIEWFIAAGQHRIPDEPFNLTPWIRVADPTAFRESLLLDVSVGPDGPRCKYGALEEELRRLRRYLNSETRP